MPKTPRGGAESGRSEPDPTPEQPTTPLSTSDRELALSVALECAARRWRVIPVNAATKIPAVKGWPTLATWDEDTIRGWFGDHGAFPFAVPGIATGKLSDLLAVDLDVASEAHPDARGEETFLAKAAQWDHEGGWGDALTVGTPSGGRHLLYRYPEEGRGADADPAYRIGNRADLYGKGSGVDIRGDGGFILAPGLPGRDWLRTRGGQGPGETPAWLLADLKAKGATSEQGERPAERSTLAQLLLDPPTEGGRNQWLAAVAGQFAARENHRDTYEVQCRDAAAKLVPPLDDAEIEKVIASIWNREQAKKKSERAQQLAAAESRSLDEPTTSDAHAATKDGDCGYLAPSRGPGDARLGALLYRGYFGSGETRQIAWTEWADFDVRVTGVLQDGDERTYEIDLLVKREVAKGLPARAVQLPSKTLADSKRLDGWLAGHGASIGESRQAVDRLARTARLQRYIDAQDPPAFTVVGHLGWHADITVPGARKAGGFVTPDGVITREGKYTGPGVRPAPALATLVDYNYGMDHPVEEVRSVLRQLLTFHHEETASVFGAWWAASLVKHAAFAATRQFPFMAIEAPSESGKTTGMFGMLIQLAGNRQGQGAGTRASFRDGLSANRNGVYWLDDADTLTDLEEILRQSTGEGVMSKKAEDRTSTITTKLVAPVVVSGESLGVGKEKALRDRSIRIRVSSPTKRKSQIPGREDRLQWDDITDLHAVYDGDLTVLSGTLVRMALRHAEDLTRWIRETRGASGGRVGDALAILQAGARLLSILTEDPSHVDRVQAWVDAQPVSDSENALTLSILPGLLARVSPASSCVVGRIYGQEIPVPYMVRPEEPGRLWVSSSQVATWWALVEGRGGNRRGLADEASLSAQLVQITEIKRRFNIVGDPNTKITYRLLPLEISQRLLDLSADDDGVYGPDVQARPGGVPAAEGGYVQAPRTSARLSPEQAARLAALPAQQNQLPL